MAGVVVGRSCIHAGGLGTGAARRQASVLWMSGEVHVPCKIKRKELIAADDDASKDTEVTEKPKAAADPKPAEKVQKQPNA